VGVVLAPVLRPANASTLEINPLTTVAGLGASGASATIGEASAKGSGEADSVESSRVGTASGGDSVSEASLTTRVLFTVDAGTWNVVSGLRFTGSAAGPTGSSAPALPGLVEVIAPPELCTIPSRGSAVEPESGAVLLVFTPPETRPITDSISCTADETAVANEFGGASLGFESAADEVEVVASEPVSAEATPGGPAMPKPTPIATASPPTRPICRAYPMMTTSPQGVTQTASHDSPVAVIDLANWG
jgi:hypothetical protein